MKPFFILGAPRSGTTMLRDIFKQIDELFSPEETHFFRWAAPFQGFEYNSFYEKNGVLIKHRGMDGISDERFFEIYTSCKTRAEFTDFYCSEVAKMKGATAWFEKTPQNVYGLPLLVDQFPDAKIIHLVRHPLSVVKSLMAGKVLKPQNLIGALNYWLEAVTIVNVLKPVMGDQLIEVRYEDLQLDPSGVIQKLSSQVIGGDKPPLKVGHVKTKIDIPYGAFSHEQIKTAEETLGKYPSLYNYRLTDSN